MAPRPDEVPRRTGIGIDIGGTRLRVGRVTEAGDIAERRAEPSPTDPQAVVARLIALIRDLDEAGVESIGIGVPGRVDTARRVVLSGGVLDFAGCALAERIEHALGKPVVLDNDCAMALAAEMAFGAGRGRRSVVMFTIGTGIGGAIVLDGVPLRGRATAGQLGHLTVDPAGPLCACGRRGCIETMSSGRALERLVAAAGLPAGLPADRLLALERASDVIAAWIRPLRSAIDSMVAALDPEVVLLGGGLGAAAQRALARAPACAPWYQCPVEAAQLGDDAGLIGAAVAARAMHGAKAA